MKNYIGFLIRKTRLQQNISQDGLCKGICTPSYLSKIEQGYADPSPEIIDQLFSALGIQYQKEPQILLEAKEHLKSFFYLWESETSYANDLEYIQQHKENLEHSELHLDLHLCMLFVYIDQRSQSQAEAERTYLSNFLPYMNNAQLIRYYLGAAEIAGYSEESLQLLEKASYYGKNSIIYYRMATVLYHLGNYDECVQQAESAYLFAAEEGNPSVLIGASFLLGSCYCNGKNLSLAEKFYGRAIALTRGYKEQVQNYAYYNLGTAYLSNRQYQKAEYYLLQAKELDENISHNIMLNQKCALLFIQKGCPQEAEKYLEEATTLLKKIPDVGDEYLLYQKMVSLPRLLLTPNYLELPEYEDILETLYDKAEVFGFGFSRFYGFFLIELYKHQRRYKEALRIREKTDIS